MGFLRRVGTILGFVKGEPHRRHHHHRNDDDGRDHRTAERRPRRPTRGSGVQVPVASSEKPFVGPVVVPCEPGEGGVQGFSWYGRRLRIDEDGDVADEFLDEVFLPVNSGAQQQQQVALHRFEIKYRTRPAPLRKQIIAINGNIHPGMEYQGMLRLV